MKAHNTRRHFLKQGVRLVTGAALFEIVPRKVLGRGFLAPSDRINIGFIGTGKQARGLAESFSPIAQLVAGADIDTEKLAAFAAKVQELAAKAAGTTTYKGFTPYANFQQILDRKDIDGVVVATPDHWHAVVSVMAAGAGKHVYCEKPLAHSVEEGRAMVNAVKRNKVVLQTGSMQRSWRNFRHACELVRNGYVGEIKEIWVTVGGPSIPCDLPGKPVPANLDWKKWVGPAVYHDYNPTLAPPLQEDVWALWRTYKEYGGGGIADWGAHMFDIAQWAMGMDASGPVLFTPPAKNAVYGLTMQYAGGVMLSHKDFHRGQAVRFIGSKGSLDISREFIDSNPASIATAEIKDSETRLYKSDNHYQNWLDCIKTGKDPVCSAETGHRTSSVCVLTNIAYWLNRPLQWDPVKELVKGDSEANMLTKAKISTPWKI